MLELVDLALPEQLRVFQFVFFRKVSHNNGQLLGERVDLDAHFEVGLVALLFEFQPAVFCEFVFAAADESRLLFASFPEKGIDVASNVNVV